MAEDNLIFFKLGFLDSVFVNFGRSLLFPHTVLGHTHPQLIQERRF